MEEPEVTEVKSTQKPKIKIIDLIGEYSIGPTQKMLPQSTKIEKKNVKS